MLMLALWSTTAWAITINVNVTGNQAPYVYAWDNDRNPLTDAYPGIQLSNIKKVGNKTWYYIDIDASSINLILSFGTDATKTGDITGITGNQYYEFANNNANNVTDYYDCPGGVVFESTPFVYLVDTRNWNKAYAYVWNGSNNNGWPGEEMQYLGVNGNGNKVYRWSAANINFTPTNIKFNNVDNSGNAIEEGDNRDWINGAFWSNYNWSYAMTVTGAILNSTYFPDSNLRKAITACTNVAEGDVITPDNITMLDISYDVNKGMTGKIANPTGIELFTALEELYARDNSFTHLDLTHTSTLRVLDVSGNDVLQGMRGISYCNATGHGVNVKGNNNFIKLVADDCPAWIYNAGLGSNNDNFQYISSLEYISQKNNPLDGWSSGFTAQAGLKYLDLTNTGQNAQHATTGSQISLSALTNLETLILANNKNLANVPYIKNCKKLQYIDLSNCAIARAALNSENFSGAGGSNLKYLDVSGNPLIYNLYLTDKNNLETLLMKNCSAYDWGAFESCPNLKHVDLSGCTAMVSTMWSHLNGTNHQQLQYLNLSNGTTAVSGTPINFPALDSLVVNNHNTITELNVTGHCPNYIDITNDPNLAILGITNCGLSELPENIIDLATTPALYRLDLTGNNFAIVPEIESETITTMVMNDNNLTDISTPANVKFLYAQNNNFPAGEYVLPATTLVGLDLGNNGFTKFKAENNETLKSISLAGSDDLEEIELHGNIGITQTSPTGTIEYIDGLYIKNLSNLKTLNIENSNFEKLGQLNSLQGVTGLTKLQARHNKFTTFTNGVYDLHTANVNVRNYRKADPTESSLEHLTALEYLDLAYNNLQDSVHLYRNVNLKHLDVSYNRSIDGQDDPTLGPIAKTDSEKQAILEKKGRRWMKYGKVNGKTYGTNATASQWTTHYTYLQALRERPFDMRTEDLNDTTGLYHLDLGKNVNLEYLDISYTNIHNTAAGPTYMCPGWMTEDWVTDDDLSATSATTKNTSGRWYSSWHNFVYFIPCSNLKVIHADHNNMRSLGIKYFPELDTLTCSYMYGDSEIMRDYNGSGDLRYGMGNTGTRTSIQKFKSVTWGESDGETTGDVVLEGNYPDKLRYWDLSYSGFNEIRLYPAAANNGELTYLEHVNVSGNPLNFQLHPNSTVSNYNSLDVTYCPNIRTVLAENCSDLPIVRAHNRAALDTLYLSNDPKLNTLYIQNDPLLKDNFAGLNTLTGLETLFGYNNTQWGGIDVTANTALKNLWVSNINASSIDVSHNTALEKLRVYDNSLSTLDVSHNTALTWLDLARNQVPSVNLNANAALQYFNSSNSEETLDDQSLVANSHNGGEADEVKPVSGTSKASNGGNSLSDLVFADGAPLADVRANYNDLHYINGSFANLNRIEFAHNHINGIDLSAAKNNSPAIVDEDNGRAITAECAKFIQHGTTNKVTVFYFQLENIRNQQLTGKTSTDSKNATRYLGEDGFKLEKLVEWDGTNAAPYVAPTTSGIRPKDVTIDPSNMNQYLDGNVEGSIVVLKEDSQHSAEGRATYTYNNGVDESTFYLDWTANADVPTSINVIDVAQGVTVAGSYGGLTINGADGTVVGVYDMSGRQVASETINGGTATITGLTPGVYVVNGSKVVVK